VAPGDLPEVAVGPGAAVAPVLVRDS